MRNRRVWALLAAVLVVGGIVAGAVWTAVEQPVVVVGQVEPVRPGATPEEGARNLAAWLLAYAGEEG